MSDLSSFLITTARTLSQMSLYSLEHPTVKAALVEAHQLLSSVLDDYDEIVLSISDNKLIVNGKVPEGVSDIALRPFITLFGNFDLHSLSFLPGITQNELAPFFTLASKGDAKKLNMDAGTFLSGQNVTHIQVNKTQYAKIGEDETVGGQKGAGAGDGDGHGGDPLIQEMESLGLNEIISQLVGRAIKNADDRSKVHNRVNDLIKQQLADTIRRATEEVRREKVHVTNERDRTEVVVGSMAEGVVVVDETGNVLMMNPAAEDIYGVKLGECLGKPLWQGVREEQMVALAKDLAVPSDRPMIKEVQLQAAQETKKTLRASSATVQDLNGRVVGMVSVLSDVTKQKELTRLQNEFMANVTHDLRTPIHALKLAVSAILEGAAGPVSSEQDKMLSLASRNVDRLARLIDDLLDFSQIESGRMKIHQQILDISPLIKESAANMDAWTKSRGVTLSVEESPNLPSVYADSDRVLQVVVNLVSNAIKFTPQGGHVTLRLKSVQDHGKPMVQVEVEDTGKGISKDDQKRIFERFIQLQQQEKLDIRGTGLGLSICKALVDLHKGQLSLISPPPGKSTGSLFYFTLPVLERAPSAPRVETLTPVTPAEPPRSFWKRLFSKFKIVLIVLASVSLAHARPFQGTVRRVISADTIQLTDGTQVRYFGIDVAARGTSRYQEAIAANRQWVEGQDVRMEYGLKERDLDGVWTAYVYADGIFVNKELVRSGLAFVAKLDNEEDYSRELRLAEREARRKKRGMWADLSLEPLTSSGDKNTGLPTASSEEIKRGMKLP